MKIICKTGLKIQKTSNHIRPVASCKHCILYPLQLEPLFPNDVEILRHKVGLGPNQIAN